MKPGLTLPSPTPKRLTSDTVPYLSLFQCASFQGNQDWSMKKDRPEKDWPVLTCTTFPCFSVPAMAAALWVCDVGQPAVQPRRGHVGDAGGGAMEGACHARRGDHGVGPPHQGVPHQPSACLICHLTQDWLLHPSLMSLWCGTSPPLPQHTHTSCQTSSQTGSSIQVWCRCGVEPLPPHHVKPLHRDWLLHPSLMSLWCGTSPPLPNTHTHHVRPLHRLAPPSKSDVAVVWNLPPSPQHTHTSCRTSSQTGSSIQVWCRCGVEPLPPHHVKPLHRDWLLHPGLMLLWCGTSPPPQHTHHVRPLHRLAPPSKSDVAAVWNLPPSPPTHTHIMSDLFTDWLLHPSLMSLRCGTSPPSPPTHTHIMSDLFTDWLLHPSLMSLRCETPPPSPPTHTHIMSDLFTDWLLHPSLMSLRCGTSPPSPPSPPTHTHIMSDLFTDWLLHPSLMSLRCGTPPPLPQHTHTSCQTSSQTGSSIQVWCRCSVEPPPPPNTHIMSDLFTDWLLHPSLMFLRCGTSPPTSCQTSSQRLAPPSRSDVAVVWNLPPSPPKHTHIMSDLFTDWLLHPSLMSLWNGTAPHPLHHVRPLHRMASQVWCHCGVEPLPTHYVKPLHKLAPPFKADVTMCGISQQPPSQFINRCLEDWLLHPSFMSKWCGTHLSPPTPPPSPPSTRMPFMLCHLAKDWYLHSSVMSPWWTSFTLRQWLYWRLAPPFQADDADFCGN